MFMRKQRRGGPTKKSQPQLLKIRKLTRELINTANESEDSGLDGDTTTPQDLEAVRTLRDAQQTLLESMQMALGAGLDSDVIRTQGIDHAVSQSIVMSDLAHFVVGEIRSRV